MRGTLFPCFDSPPPYAPVSTTDEYKYGAAGSLSFNEILTLQITYLRLFLLQFKNILANPLSKHGAQQNRHSPPLRPGFLSRG